MEQGCRPETTAKRLALRTGQNLGTPPQPWEVSRMLSEPGSFARQAVGLGAGVLGLFGPLWLRKKRS